MHRKNRVFGSQDRVLG
jgi:hypothetical protein